MSILKNIEDQREFIKASPTGAGKTRADEISAAAKEAIFNGINSVEWKNFMSLYFAKSKEQLDRLTHKDEKFNNSQWGEMSLAYIAGNALCTVRTSTATGTIMNMPTEMQENLDAVFSE